MKYILDTNAVSDLMRGDPAVCRRLTERDRTDVLLAQPVVAEIEYGLARLRASTRKRRLRHRFDVFLAEMMRVPWTDEVSRAFGSIKAGLERRGMRIEDFDTAVAAHALALGATLVTDNVAHMSRIPGLSLENWRE